MAAKRLHVTRNPLNVAVDRYQAKYGFWRPGIRKAVHESLQRGDPLEGFARVRPVTP